MEVDEYVNHKSIIKENIQKAYYQVLVQFINLKKLKLKHIISQGQ